MKLRIGREGIVFSLDMIVALVFFLSMILTMLWLWGEVFRHINDHLESQARQTRLLEVSSMLVKTQGNPPNWHAGAVDPDVVDSIGLAGEENVLDEGKLQAFVGADYEDLRRIMGFGSENFYLTVSEDWDTTPTVLYFKGVNPASSERRVMIRYALLDKTKVEVKLQTFYAKR